VVCSVIGDSRPEGSDDFPNGPGNQAELNPTDAVRVRGVAEMLDEAVCCPVLAVCAVEAGIRSTNSSLQLRIRTVVFQCGPWATCGMTTE